MSRSPVRRRRLAATRGAALAVMVGLPLTACGPHPQASIAIRSTALNLQFARPDLAKPIPPNVIVRMLPAPPSGVVQGGGAAVPGTPRGSTAAVPTLALGQCPPSSRPAKPAAALQESTTTAPGAGFYTYNTKGTGTVSGGSQNVSAAMPSRTEVAISRASKAQPDAAAAAEGGVPASGTEAEYTVTTHLSGTVSQVDELMVSASSINLMQRTLTDGQRTMIFTPTPQVQLVRFGPVGSSWKSGGTDSSNSAVMNYQATIARTKVMDVCGQLVRADEVTYSESLASPADGEIIRTSGNDPNTFTIAPQLGGLVISEHVDTSDIRFDANLSGYIGVTLDYTSTVSRLTPSTTLSAA